MENTPLVKTHTSTSSQEDQQNETPFYMKPKFIRKWLILLIVALIIVVVLSSKFFNKVWNGGTDDFLPDSNKNYQTLLGNNPFSEYTLCSDETNPPTLNSYHMHAVFDGDNKESTQIAISKFYQFKEYINPNMDECPFSHNNAGLTQTEICYFPFYFEETDFPVTSHKLWNSAQYAFFLPSNYVEIGMNWWMQHHYSNNICDDNEDCNENEFVSFDLALHPATGCQEMSHSAWLVTNNEFSSNLIYENLPCCHTGPSSCTCDLVSFEEKESQLCLSLQFDEANTQLSFQLSQCQEYSLVQNVKSDDSESENTGIYSAFWRETFYDSDNNWIQIENYGPFDDYIPKNCYLCLSVDTNNDNLIKMADCSMNSNIEESSRSEWIADITKFSYDNDLEKIKYLGGDDTTSMCLSVSVVDSENDNDSDKQMVEAKLESCQDASSFTRVFFP